MTTTPSARSGTILIIVAGLSALLAAMALTFLARMRSDVDESNATVREAQAHLMKVAACNFIMEKARLGWDPEVPDGSPRTLIRRESFGWIDVRDGRAGPRGEDGEKLGPTSADGTPVMGADGKPKWDEWVDLALTDDARPAKRCPMQVLVRPPFAVSPRVAVNPITLDGANPLKPYVIEPDPQRFDRQLNAAQFRERYVTGDTRPDLARYVPSWFRVWRAGPARFVVTCGMGETMGFRDWQEVVDAGQAAAFGGDGASGQAFFAVLQTQETRLWYLVEWSPHVASSDYQNLQNEFSHQEITHPIPQADGKPRKTTKAVETYLQRPINVSQESRSQGLLVNPVGTIRLIQRLLNEPDHW
jgi:hypothetical protein